MEIPETGLLEAGLPLEDHFVVSLGGWRGKCGELLLAESDQDGCKVPVELSAVDEIIGGVTILPSHHRIRGPP